MKTRTTAWLAATMLVAGALPMIAGRGAAQEATPTAVHSCEDTAAMAAAGTPAVMARMDMGSPAAETDMMTMGLDLMYIDMTIPHHASIIAMAQAAQTRLGDDRLRDIAEAIIASQQPEIDELRAVREAIGGSPNPMPMNDTMMAAMDEMMPGISGSAKEMAFQMDGAAQVAAICNAKDADLAFIELTIPHHQMAIEASRAVLDESDSEVLREFARRVIDVQQREIDELNAIRAELAGADAPATPSADQSAHAGEHSGDAGMALEADDLGIRALPTDIIAQIERGEGAGFALPAERNGVPGPRHVLDLGDELGLSVEQRADVQRIFDDMQAAAIPAGTRYLAAQAALEADLRGGALDLDALPARVTEVSRLQGELASIHLAAHLQTAALLTPEQIEAYVALRSTE